MYNLRWTVHCRVRSVAAKLAAHGSLSVSRWHHSGHTWPSSMTLPTLAGPSRTLLAGYGRHGPVRAEYCLWVRASTVTRVALQLSEDAAKLPQQSFVVTFGRVTLGLAPSSEKALRLWERSIPNLGLRAVMV